jgi:hypothetical protein
LGQKRKNQPKRNSGEVGQSRSLQDFVASMVRDLHRDARLVEFIATPDRQHALRIDLAGESASWFAMPTSIIEAAPSRLVSFRTLKHTLQSMIIMLRSRRAVAASEAISWAT